MSRVERQSIVDYMTYEEQRDQTRKEVLEVKRPRRIHVGEYLTFLFENCATIRYQVQEMMRIERIVREADILHELSTYNELLGRDQYFARLTALVHDPNENQFKYVAPPGGWMAGINLRAESALGPAKDFGACSSYRLRRAAT